MSTHESVQPVDLVTLAAEYHALADTTSRRIVVCAGTGCIAGGTVSGHIPINR